MGISTAPEVLERIKDTARRILAHGRVKTSWTAQRRVWGRRLLASSELCFGSCVGGSFCRCVCQMDTCNSAFCSMYYIKPAQNWTTTPTVCKVGPEAPSARLTSPCPDNTPRQSHALLLSCLFPAYTPGQVRVGTLQTEGQMLPTSRLKRWLHILKGCGMCA